MSIANPYLCRTANDIVYRLFLVFSVYPLSDCKYLTIIFVRKGNSITLIFEIVLVAR